MEALTDKFIEIIASSKEISKPDASKLLNNCFKRVAIIENISEKEVITQFYARNFFEECIRGKCSDLELQECRKSCHCVVFEEKCYPRMIRDYAQINSDPDKYVLTLSTANLEKLVKFSAFLYYNYEGGGLTDNSFDALEYNLNKRLRIRGKRYEKIGADPLPKMRIDLPIPMPSLNKVKPGTRELTNFINDIPLSGLSWSVKLDGVSGMLVYKDSILTNVFTRGNGIIGGNITYLQDYIQLPKKLSYTSSMIVRGEFVVKKEIFTRKYNKLYSNPRSFVSALINQGYVSPYLLDLEFIAYEIMQYEDADDLLEPSRKFSILDIEGFKVVENGFFNKGVLVFDIASKYIEKRIGNEYQIDGLVLSYNAPGIVLKELKNPLHTVAFKMLLDEQIRDTKVISVDYKISRYGKYIPVAVYEAVYVDGVRLTRASAYNAAHVRDWNMGAGTLIKVARSGDVIPIIKNVTVDRRIEPIFPDDKYEWQWDNRDIILDDIENNPDVQIQRNYHFFFTLGTPQLGEKTIEKFWQAGLKTIKDITNASPKDFIQIKGIGKIKSQTIYNNIHNALRTNPLDRYVIAYSNIRIGIGRMLVKELVKNFPNIFEKKYSEKQISEMLWKKKNTTGLQGFGKQRIESVSKNLPEFREFLFSLNKEDIQEAINLQQEKRKVLEENGYNRNIEGKTFVLSGFAGRTDYELEDYIYDNMGYFSTTLSADVAAVICPSLSVITPKMIEAQKMGIPVFTLEEFKAAYEVVYYNPFANEDGEEQSQEMALYEGMVE